MPIEMNATDIAMLIKHDREKLIQAINFFIRNTRKCGKVKLFKLLYFLDFEHFKITGRNVTGLDYYAWPMGPVPVSLYGEIDSPEPDLARAMRFEEKPIRNGTQTMLIITPNIEFSDIHFTKRELQLMTRLASEYKDAESDDMIEATHLENMPWDKIYNKQNQRQGLIPYDLAPRLDEKDEILRLSSERKELLDKFS